MQHARCLVLVRPLPAHVHETERATLAPDLRVVERFEGRQREVMHKLRVVRLADAYHRLALRPYARPVSFQPVHEFGRVRQKVAMQYLRDLVGGGDRWWKGFPGKDIDPGDSRV